MSRLGKIARRGFLIGSAAVVGGVAFGGYMLRKPHANPLSDGLGDGEAALTPWVKVTSDGITLVTPHADVGQGIYHAQAVLIAEEMDLELGQFQVDPGLPAAAYYNTAMADEAVPFAPTDDGFGAEAMRGIMGGVFKLAGMQGTGGSSSIPDSYVKLRRAGAVARETLKRAAARQSGVSEALLRTEAGQVVFPDGTAIAYTDLAVDAASVEPVQEVSLRPASQWRLIGKDLPRLDIVGKSTGTLPYGIDLRVDGMVFATVRCNPGRSPVRTFDASAAKEMPGVTRVLPVRNGVAVVATNTWYAIQAAQAIDMTFEPPTFPPEQADHWAVLGRSFASDHLDRMWRDDGNVARAVGQRVPDMEYRAPYVAHHPLEPLNAIVRVEADLVDVWTSHQMPRFVQQKVAAVTGHDPEQVVFHNQYAGGSFGHRLEFENITLAAEIADQMRGTPVKLIFSREEDFAQDFVRQNGMARASGTVKDGRVESFDLSIATPSVLASQAGRLGLPMAGPDNQIAAGAWHQPYAIPHFRVSGYKAEGLAPVSSWRSVGASTAGFFAESMLDEIIHAAGADPMEERLRLMDHEVSRKVLEAVAEMSNWGGALGEGQGRGVAFVNSFGVPTAQVVEVTSTEDGIRLDRVFVAVDVGQVIDPVTLEAQVSGGVIFGLGAAINQEITYSEGAPEQSNFDGHEGIRMYQTPEITVRALENADKIRGIGEPGVPPAAPALANAIFAATGQRLREMPFWNHIDFV